MEKLSSDRVRLSASEAQALADQAMQRIGIAAEEARIIAEHVLDAALCGYEYAGLPKLLDVAENRRLLEPRRPIRAIHETPVSALFDGGNNIGMFANFRATEVAIAKASEHGFAVVGMNNIWMSGRIAFCAEKVARAGLVCIYCVGARRDIAPPDGIGPAIGPNPIAFAFPTLHDPFVVDTTTSASFGMALLLFHERLGKPLPEGVAIDAQGRPTRDPGQVHALLPSNGHRGFVLGMAMQAMAVLGGMGSDVIKSFGHLIIVIKPDLLMPSDEFRREMTAMLERVKATPRQPGVEEIRLPSERAFRERARRLRDGIEIDRQVYDALLALPERKLSGRA